MKNQICIEKTINPFNKNLEIEGDKSLSIRWALLASQAIGKSTATNILKSEDVLNTLKCLKKLGVKIKIYENKCEIFLFTLIYLSFFLFVIELILKKTKLIIISLVYLNLELKIYSYSFNFCIIF